MLFSFYGFSPVYSWGEKKTGWKCPGAVAFIGILLMIAGIEPNPGPLPKDHTKATDGPQDDWSFATDDVHQNVVRRNLSVTGRLEQHEERRGPVSQNRPIESAEASISSNTPRDCATYSPRYPCVPAEDSDASDVKNHKPDKPPSESAMNSSIERSSDSLWSTEYQSKQNQTEQRAQVIRESLGLTDKFPSKIRLDDAIQISTRPIGNTVTDLPMSLLRELIMVNFKARDMCPHKVYGAEQQDEDSEDSTDSDDADEEGEIIYDKSASKFNVSTLNNHDIFISIFNCCDHKLRQVLVSKMFACRLAVPLVYPTFQSGSICFSLSPLRSIHLELKEKENVSMFLAEHTQKVVSFIRISRPRFSKSTLLNSLLSTERHPTFYDNECLLGQRKREITNGLVEASWYMSNEENDEVLQGIIMFTNLRGNALDHQKQVNLLTDMSNCLVIIVDYCDVEEHLDFIESLKTKAKSTLLFLAGQKPQSVSRRFEQISQGIKLVRHFRKHQGKNVEALKLEFKKKISQILLRSFDTSLENCASSADKQGIPVDELFSLCETSRQHARLIVHHLDKASPIDVKKEFLPLQGELWMAISKCMKELKCSNSKPTDDEYNQEKSIWEKEPIKQKLKKFRADQSSLADKSLAVLFIEYLERHIHNEDYIANFLQWIRYYLDNNSYLVLQHLMAEYNQCWEEYSKSKQTDTQVKVQQLEKQLRLANENIVEASLGFEHILREVGQLYESSRFSHSSYDQKAWVKGIPKIAAKLLLSGYPLELIDGDASNIPTSWIEAVFQSCHELLGDKSVYIISILGVQSSGKSTFLNSLFGLQFPVSAGRCTKGVYMQMLPVDKSCGFPIDYLIVLDTEGLRAPECDFKMHDYDNVLATFAIGIADMTVINIKGENTSEVKDVLEIVIHALLRLKLANADLRFKTSCVFVHQNVSASNASFKLQQSRQKLVDLLDGVTKDASEQLRINNAHTFRHLIDFDIQKDVWYMPDLWNGDPPMAHINPGYSKNVAAIKKSILEQIRSTASAAKNLLTTHVNILDLWNGILSEDFVFSFRNSLEVKTYNIMVCEYRKNTWELEQFYMKWMLQNRNNTGDSFEEILNKVFREKSENLYSNLKRFFESNQNRQELIKWKEVQLLNFRSFSDELILRAKNECREIRKQKDLLLKVKTINEGDLQDIHEQAKVLAKRLKGQKPSNNVLQAEFDLMWSRWLQKLQVGDHTYTESLVTRIYNILLEFDQQKRNQIYLEVNRQNWPSHVQYLSSSDKCLKCKYETHIQIKAKNVMNKVRGVLQPRSRENCQIMTGRFQRKLFADINSLINRYSSHSNVWFQNGHLGELLNMIDKKIDEHNNNDNDFDFLPQYRAMIMVYVSRYVLHVFAELHERHSRQKIIATYRSTTWSFFKNLVNAKTNLIISATFVSEAMKTKLNESLQQHVAIEIISRVRTDLSHSKSSLIVQILDYLANIADFSMYKEYLITPSDFAFNWIKHYTNDRCFTKSEYVDIVSEYIKVCIGELKTNINEAAEKSKQVAERKMETFISAVNKVSFPEYATKQMCEYELNDVDAFVNEIQQKLSDLQTEMVKEHKMKSADNIEWVNSPYKSIYQGLWGCEEVCPLCGEPCQKMEDHGKNEPHTCIQHRPEGVRGTRKTNKKLTVENCSFLVQSGKKASCGVFMLGCRNNSDCRSEVEVFHPYKNYKEYLPNWDIAPSSDMESSKYWMWFMVTFSKELAEWQNAETPDIPESWKSISKEEARASLKGLL